MTSAPLALAIVAIAIATFWTLAVAPAVRKVTTRRIQQSENRAKSAIEAVAPLLEATQHSYLRHSNVAAWVGTHPNRTELLPSRSNIRLLKDPDLRDRYATAIALIRDPFVWAAEQNERFVTDRCEAMSTWFEGRFPNPLTDEQRRAVVTDEDANLVVAGAGSGKTVTLIAKLAYLIEHRGVQPNEILVLAFNRTVAEEIAARVSASQLPLPEIATFHAKGVEVIGRSTGRRPAVSVLASDQRALLALLESTLLVRARTASYFTKFKWWWVDLRVEADELKQDTPDERLRKECSLGLRTLDGTLVQSQSEVKVGDWLTLHGISWEHETRYPHSPASSERRDYTPDFYLPEHDAWIEVWACDAKEERFPPEIDRKRYSEDMAWKRTIHEEHRTTLIEINQTDIWVGPLDEILTERLAETGIELRPLEPDELDALIESVRSSFTPLAGLMASFLRLFRAGGWTRGEVEARAKKKPRDRVFVELFWPLLDAYEERLAAEGKIDFDAMLIEAASALEAAGEPSRYRYILVDEYQDTSRARLELVRRLRGDAAFCQLFLVGDDWQSIYRFTGSDVGYFTEAERYLGPTAHTDLGRTFRLTSHVAELSTHFVTKNPSQLRKTIVPRSHDDDVRGVSIRLHPAGGESMALSRVLREIAADSPQEKPSVLVLGRYNFSLDVLQSQDLSGLGEVKALTVHRAKGLEADYAVVVGLSGGTFGFPSEVEDDPVLRLLLAEEGSFPNAEERRLFYVALTRARSRVYLLASDVETSPFVQELLEPAYASWIEWAGEETRRYRCPRCRGRTIRRYVGEFGAFWGCGHYPACHGRLPHCGECGIGVLEPDVESRGPRSYSCVNCGHATRVCPKCRSGALVRREGLRGLFLGCSEWRFDGSGCDYTESVAERGEGG